MGRVRKIQDKVGRVRKCRVMNPPQERIDQFWIRQTEEIIASAVRKIQDQVGRVRKIQHPVAESGNSRIMNPPQERIDQFWIRQTEEMIASAVKKIQDQVGKVRKVQDQVGRVRKQQDHEPVTGEDRPVLDQADRGDHCQRRQDYKGSGELSQENAGLDVESQDYSQPNMKSVE